MPLPCMLWSGARKALRMIKLRQVSEQGCENVSREDMLHEVRKVSCRPGSGCNEGGPVAGVHGRWALNCVGEMQGYNGLQASHRVSSPVRRKGNALDGSAYGCEAGEYGPSSVWEGVRLYAQGWCRATGCVGCGWWSCTMQRLAVYVRLETIGRRTWRSATSVCSVHALCACEQPYVLTCLKPKRDAASQPLRVSLMSREIRPRSQLRVLVPADRACTVTGHRVARRSTLRSPSIVQVVRRAIAPTCEGHQRLQKVPCTSWFSKLCNKSVALDRCSRGRCCYHQLGHPDIKRCRA